MTHPSDVKEIAGTTTTLPRMAVLCLQPTTNPTHLYVSLLYGLTFIMYVVILTDFTVHLSGYFPLASPKVQHTYT